MARQQMFSDRTTQETDWPRVGKVLLVIGLIVAGCVALYLI